MQSGSKNDIIIEYLVQRPESVALLHVGDEGFKIRVRVNGTLPLETQHMQSFT